MPPGTGPLSAARTGKRKGSTIDDEYGDAAGGSHATPVSTLRDPRATSTLVYGEFPAACGPTYVSRVEVTRLHDDVYVHGRNYHPGRVPRITALSRFVVSGLPFRTAQTRLSAGKM